MAGFLLLGKRVHCYGLRTAGNQTFNLVLGISPRAQAVQFGMGRNRREFTKGVCQVINILKNLHKEESGQDLIEYALLALLIALAAVAILPTVGKSISNEFSKVAGQLT
jgi:pilus assembly protein Flp/PilA